MMEQYPNVIKSFNEDFCRILTDRLWTTLENLPTNNKFEQFGYDAVCMPFVDSRLYESNINRTKEIITYDYIGLTGEEEPYYMTIKPGPLSLEKCNPDLPLVTCLPGTDSMDWITLDVIAKTIELRLL